MGDREKWDEFKAECLKNPECKEAYEEAVRENRRSFIVGERGPELVDLPGDSTNGVR